MMHMVNICISNISIVIVTCYHSSISTGMAVDSYELFTHMKSWDSVRLLFIVNGKATRYSTVERSSSKKSSTLCKCALTE